MSKLSYFLFLVCIQSQLEKNTQVFASVKSSNSQSFSSALMGGDSSVFGGDDSAKLIIMDRGMDLKTPLMHDLTFLVSIFCKTGS